MQLLEIPEQTQSADIDEEIIEIFIEEVEEILEEIIHNFDTWKYDFQDSESLKNLRRCFHTLKGSGRLVGATAIGELGWRFENMLNQVINGRLPRSPEMLELVEKVEKVLPGMIEQFQNGQPVREEIVLLISQAHNLTESTEPNQSKPSRDIAPPNKISSISATQLESELNDLAKDDFESSKENLELGIDEIESNLDNLNIEEDVLNGIEEIEEIDLNLSIEEIERL